MAGLGCAVSGEEERNAAGDVKSPARFPFPLPFILETIVS